MAKTKIRQPYSGEKIECNLAFHDEEGNLLEECRTEQHHADSCNIENILAEYDRTGVVSNINKAVAQYGDFSEVNEFQESQNMVIQYSNAFMELPSEIREQFNNDAGSFFEFASNPANKEQMQSMGLIEQELVLDPKVEAEIAPKEEKIETTEDKAN